MSDQRKNHGKSKKNVLVPAATSLADVPPSYAEVLQSIKTQIQQSRLKAVLSANSSLVLLYWQIGQIILTRQTNEGWGAKVIDRLSFDLKDSFPDMKGFSPRNLKYMRAFTDAFPDFAIVQRVVAQLPYAA
jgi:predicted nuclease of restriction endonuclease-like (RecB) superfamily